MAFSLSDLSQEKQSKEAFDAVQNVIFVEAVKSFATNYNKIAGATNLKLDPSQKEIEKMTLEAITKRGFNAKDLQGKDKFVSLDEIDNELGKEDAIKKFLAAENVSRLSQLVPNKQQIDTIAGAVRDAVYEQLSAKNIATTTTVAAASGIKDTALGWLSSKPAQAATSDSTETAIQKSFAEKVKNSAINNLKQVANKDRDLKVLLPEKRILETGNAIYDRVMGIKNTTPAVQTASAIPVVTAPAAQPAIPPVPVKSQDNQPPAPANQPATEPKAVKEAETKIKAPTPTPPKEQLKKGKGKPPKAVHETVTVTGNPPATAPSDVKPPPAASIIPEPTPKASASIPALSNTAPATPATSSIGQNSAANTAAEVAPAPTTVSPSQANAQPAVNQPASTNPTTAPVNHPATASPPPPASPPGAAAVEIIPAVVLAAPVVLPAKPSDSPAAVKAPESPASVDTWMPIVTETIEIPKISSTNIEAIRAGTAKTIYDIVQVQTKAKIDENIEAEKDKLRNGGWFDSIKGFFFKLLDLFGLGDLVASFFTPSKSDIAQVSHQVATTVSETLTAKDFKHNGKSVPEMNPEELKTAMEAKILESLKKNRHNYAGLSDENLTQIAAGAGAALAEPKNFEQLKEKTPQVLYSQNQAPTLSSLVPNNSQAARLEFANVLPPEQFTPSSSAQGAGSAAQR